jgi:hypothetical protein
VIGRCRRSTAVVAASPSLPLIPPMAKPNLVALSITLVREESGGAAPHVCQRVLASSLGRCSLQKQAMYRSCNIRQRAPQFPVNRQQSLAAASFLSALSTTRIRQCLHCLSIGLPSDLSMACCKLRGCCPSVMSNKLYCGSWTSATSHRSCSIQQAPSGKGG